MSLAVAIAGAGLLAGCRELHLHLVYVADGHTVHIDSPRDGTEAGVDTAWERPVPGDAADLNRLLEDVDRASHP